MLVSEEQLFNSNEMHQWKKWRWAPVGDIN